MLAGTLFCAVRYATSPRHFHPVRSKHSPVLRTWEMLRPSSVASRAAGRGPCCSLRCLNATPPERRGMTGWGRCMPRPVRSQARCRSPRSDPAGAGCGPSASAERYGLPLRSERPSGLPRRRGDAATQGSAWHFALQGEVPCDLPQSGAVTSIQQPINLANRCQRVRSECPPTPGLNL